MAMRLLTRSDFDGICCAVLLKEMGIIDRMTYAHPKDLQDGIVQVTKEDVLANVPYVEGCGLWFDHHSSEEERLKLKGKFKGRSEPAPSAARVVYNYYYYLGKLYRFEEMLEYVDKVDSAQLTEDDILNPEGWILLGFLCDPRTGLGYHHGFRVSNIRLMEDLVEYLREKPVEEILALPDVKERVERYFEFNQKYREFLLDRSRTDGPVVITDTRGAGEIPPGNRFLVYSLFPDANISIRLIDGKGGETATISVGHSITNRTSTANVGLLMLKYGGGGHRTVGACQVPVAEADRAFGEILEAIKTKP
jgi:hypothetical protein